MEEFIYQAIFQPDKDNLVSRDIIFDPAVYVYIENFGRADDYCMVAEHDGTVVGMVWVRLLAGEIKGFGNIDNTTPEFAISVLPQYRGKGIGKRMMEDMLGFLKQKGYKQVSLAVQKKNYAVRLYENVGFKKIAENEQEWIMLHTF